MRLRGSDKGLQFILSRNLCNLFLQLGGEYTMYDLCFCLYKISYICKGYVRLDSLLKTLQICLITRNLKLPSVSCTLVYRIASMHSLGRTLDPKGRNLQVSPSGIFTCYPLSSGFLTSLRSSRAQPGLLRISACLFQPTLEELR